MWLSGRVADELAGGAATLSGQATERTPVVPAGRHYDSGEGINSDVGFVRAAIVPTILQSFVRGWRNGCHRSDPVRDRPP